jgi:competence protein ComFC
MKHELEIKGRAFQKGKPFIQFFKRCYCDLLDFIYPPVCLSCKERFEGTSPVCELCSCKLEAALRVIVQEKEEDFQHLKGDMFFDGIVTCWEYTTQIENLIHYLKYERGKRTGRFLGVAAAKGMADYFRIFENPVLVPVPLHKIRYRERGFNQAEIICRSLGSPMSIPVQTDILVRTRNTSTQTKLDAEERHENVRDAFRIRDKKSIEGRQIILVDDVITTGATMNSCSKCLKQGGADKVIGLALARPVLDWI